MRGGDSEGGSKLQPDYNDVVVLKYWVFVIAFSSTVSDSFWSHATVMTQEGMLIPRHVTCA